MEIYVLEADPHDPDTVVAGDLELGTVVLNQSESRYPCGSETLDLKLSMTLDPELHDLLHFTRKSAILSARAAQSASVTYLSAMTDFLPVRLVEPTLERVPVGLRDADSNLEDFLSHETSLKWMMRIERMTFPRIDAECSIRLSYTHWEEMT